jgi:hypothetical protein
MILAYFCFGKQTLLIHFYSPLDHFGLGLEYCHVYDLDFGEIQLSLQLVYQVLLSLSLCLALFNRLLCLLKISLELLDFLSFDLSGLLELLICLILGIHL